MAVQGMSLLFFGPATDRYFEEIKKLGFPQVHQLDLAQPALQAINDWPLYDVVVAKLGKDDASSGISIVAASRRRNRQTFIIVASRTAASDASIRMHCTDQGANMVTADIAAFRTALTKIVTTRNTGNMVCQYCKMGGLSEDALWEHGPLYHINEPNISADCVLCNKRVQRWGVHFHNSHGLTAKGLHAGDDTPDNILFAFALVVCRRPSDGKFLLVQEFANSGYWLPGGRVNTGEQLSMGAIRETKEEAGIDIVLKGVLRVEFSPHKDHSRMRVIFYAEPANEQQPPKTIPDYESVGAVWASAAEIVKSQQRLRGREPLQWTQYLQKGGQVYPLAVLSRESDDVL